MTVAHPGASSLCQLQAIGCATGHEFMGRIGRMFTCSLMAQESAVRIIDINDAHHVAASLFSPLQALCNHLPIHHQLQDLLLLAQAQAHSAGPHLRQARKTIIALWSLLKNLHLKATSNASHCKLLILCSHNWIKKLPMMLGRFACRRWPACEHKAIGNSF